MYSYRPTSFLPTVPSLNNHKQNNIKKNRFSKKFQTINLDTRIQILSYTKFTG